MSGRVVNNTMVVGIAVVLIAMAWIVRDGDRPAAPTPTLTPTPLASSDGLRCAGADICGNSDEVPYGCSDSRADGHSDAKVDVHGAHSLDNRQHWT